MPEFRATVPYADAERDVLKVARVPLPAFDEAARAGDIFKEEAEAAVLGMKTPEAAMAAVVQRVKPLLPAGDEAWPHDLAKTEIAEQTKGNA